MKSLSTTALTCSFLLMASASNALQIPTPTDHDHRIKSVVYNPDDVVKLDTTTGIVTEIVFRKNEKYQTHQFGDSAAYSIVPSQNVVFVKPIAEKAHTNLLLVTDARRYKFKLNHRDNRDDATYSLKIEYPDVDKEEEKQARKRINNVAEFNSAFDLQRVPSNYKYYVSGDNSIGLAAVWDDGSRTFFKFHANTEIPAIYMIREGRTETIINRHTIGASNNIAVMHGVSYEWGMRVGEASLIVRNDAYDRAGPENNTGTTSPWIIREIIGLTDD